MFTSKDRINTAGREVHAVMHEAQQMLAEASAATGDRAAELQRRAMDLLSSSIGKAHELERKSIHSIRDVAASTDQLVQDYPWRSAAVSGLVGAGIGLLLGMAIARE